MKLPQLLLSKLTIIVQKDSAELRPTVVKARSARGLSYSAYVLETLAYAFTLAYAVRNEFPFSTYGENLFLTIQNVIITLLIVAYSPRSSGKGGRVAGTIVATVGTGVALWLAPPSAMQALVMATVPLGLFSKLPQIRQNFRSQSTGQLSVFAVLSQVLGCLARLFTTATEVGDVILAAGFGLALFLNVILSVQLWLYWGKDDGSVKENMIDLGKVAQPQGITTSRPAAPVAVAAYENPYDSVQRTRTPPPRGQSPALGNRKWTRKVD